MAAKKKPQSGNEPWQLDRSEVRATSYTGIRRSRSGQVRRSRRVFESGAGRRVLVHLPTGIEVSRDIPAGHYSRNELRQAHTDADAQLLVALERKVARALRIPGRSN